MEVLVCRLAIVLATIPLGVQASGATTPAAPIRSVAVPVSVRPLVRGLESVSAVRSAGVPLVPRSGALLGAYVDDTGRWIDDSTAEAGVARFEVQIGRTLDIDHHYYAWTDAFPTGLEHWDLANGRIPLISWGGTALDGILSGRFDRMIRQRALAVKALGAPVFLRWGWEMNGDWSSQDGSHNNTGGETNGPEKFVMAWRHIHRLFDAAGATNAVWVWSPNAADVPSASWNHWTRYYPGDRFVDWVGIDAYNWGTTHAWSSWASLGSMIAPLYADYARRKPIMIAETASTSVGGDKAAWLANVRTSLESRFPGVAALVYFETVKETDWSVSSSPGALQAFRVLASDPYFAPQIALLAAARPDEATTASVDTGSAVARPRER